MMMRLPYLIPVMGYLLGSIPFGYLIVRITAGTDIRSLGSGNIGATNVYRKNRWAGVLTLLLDGAKGYLAVTAAAWMGGGVEWQAVAAVAAICGHVFTVWLGFKGGKGVAVACGAYLAISPAALGLTLVLFVLVVALTRFISLGSILGTATYPLWAYFCHEPLPVLISGVIGALLIIVKHHENIRRLLTGKERKFAFVGRS